MPRPQETVLTGPTKRLAEWLNANWDIHCSLTIAEVAERFGYRGNNAVSMWRPGKSNVPIERLPDVAKLLNVPLEHLFPLYIEQYVGDKPALWDIYRDMLARICTPAEWNVVNAARKGMAKAQSTGLTKHQLSMIEKVTADAELAKQLLEADGSSPCQSAMGFHAPADIEEFNFATVEGAGSLKQHLERERDQELRQRKMAAVKASEGQALCQVCRQCPDRYYDAMLPSVLECHHIVPLGKADGERATTLCDVILVCPTCHRKLHASRDVISYCVKRHLTDTQLIEHLSVIGFHSFDRAD